MSERRVEIAGEMFMFVSEGGRGQPVVFVGGLGDDHTLFDPLVSCLDRQYRCIAFDNRGSGASSPVPPAVEISAFADDAHRLLERMGLTQVSAVGCSMGGAIVQEWALRHPSDLSRVVLISSFARCKDRLRAVLDHWARLNDAQMFDRLAESLAVMCLSPQHWDVDPVFAQALLEPGPMAPGFAAQLDACKRHDTVESIPELSVPALVIGGLDDFLVDPNYSIELARLMPDARLELWPTGHVPFWERPERTAEAIAKFIASDALEASNRRGSGR